MAPFLSWWRIAPLYRLIQESGHVLWQTFQSEYCGWYSATSIHSYFLHQTVYMGAWPHQQVARLHVASWSIRNFYRYVCKPGLGHPFITNLVRQGKEIDNPIQKWLLTVLRGLWWSGTRPYKVCQARVWCRPSTVQLVPGSTGSAAVQSSMMLELKPYLHCNLLSSW